MTPQPPEQEWIISDKDYHIALEYFHLEARPLSDELKKERERVLDKLSIWMENYFDTGYDESGRDFGYIRDIIKSLRGEP